VKIRFVRCIELRHNIEKGRQRAIVASLENLNPTHKMFLQTPLPPGTELVIDQVLRLSSGEKTDRQVQKVVYRQVIYLNQVGGAQSTGTTQKPVPLEWNNHGYLVVVSHSQKTEIVRFHQHALSNPCGVYKRNP